MKLNKWGFCNRGDVGARSLEQLFVCNKCFHLCIRACPSKCEICTKKHVGMSSSRYVLCTICFYRLEHENKDNSIIG